MLPTSSQPVKHHAVLRKLQFLLQVRLFFLCGNEVLFCHCKDPKSFRYREGGGEAAP